jgi:hypothetical protein
MRKLHYKDENFFSIPNTINSSIVGTLAADGHLRARRVAKHGVAYEVSLAISRKDKKLLEDIKSITKTDYNIRDYQVNDTLPNGKYYECPMSVLAFYSAEKWVNDLNKHWNLNTGNKALRVLPPNLDNLDHSLAFICGLINGDGSIYIANKKQKTHNLRITMLGTELLLNWCRQKICEFLGHNIRGKVRKERPKANIFSFAIGGRSAAKLIDKINKMDVIRLSRKWNNPEILELANRIKDKPVHKFVKNKSSHPTNLSVIIEESKVQV